jgi:hypothetical protein
MAANDEREPDRQALPVNNDLLAYREGYTRVMREFAWAREHGFVPSERQIVLALTQAMKVYDAVRGGKSIAGRQPEWLHGRADALRTLLRNGIGGTPADREFRS